MENAPWEIESIPDAADAWRLIPSHMVKKGSRIPSESMFVPDVDGLSVDWSKYSSPEESLIRTGLTFRFNSSEFKDPSRFLVFKLNVGQVRKQEGIIAVNHTPIFQGNPPSKGNPNNRSHSSILGSDEEVRLKLRDAAVERKVDMDSVVREVLAIAKFNRIQPTNFGNSRISDATIPKPSATKPKPSTAYCDFYANSKALISNPLRPFLKMQQD